MLQNIIKFPIKLVGDFETTVFEGQEYTEVWASGLVEMYRENVIIHTSISDTFNYLVSLNKNVCVFYHNLKFDGHFWLSYLLKDLGLTQALYLNGEDENSVSFYDTRDMPNNSVKYSINNLGQWYSITVKYHNHYIEFRDSLKLIPFSVSEMGKAFKTKHQKLELESGYEGVRFAGGELTEQDKEYLTNDLLVVKEALEFMFSQGYKKMTIASCCKKIFKDTEFYCDKDYFNALFPNLRNIKLDKDKYGSSDVDEYVRKSYKGGWCYVVKGKEQKVFVNGLTADVNSLYPSMMYSESGNFFPVGKPTFWKGNYIHLNAVTYNENMKSYPYYFVRIKTEFKLKEGYLPCIQIKGNPNYSCNEWLETSDVTFKACKVKGKYYPKRTVRNPVELTLTQTDFELIQEHYDLINMEILDGCYFSTISGIFDKYIDKFKKIKIESEGAMRTLAKLSLNSLYGKFATSANSSFKYAYIKDDGSLGFKTQREHKKQVFYIPIGSAITSYARNFTIRAAQKNYYGADKRGFIYADTDSIHCDLAPEEMKGIKVHESDFCCWKLETSWDKGWFVRQKTYIEHVTHKNLKPIEAPFYNIKCAGMNEKAKHFYQISMLDDVNKWIADNKKEYNKMAEVEKEYIKEHKTIEDFKAGFIGVGKLVPHSIKGGVVLCNTLFTLR